MRKPYEPDWITMRRPKDEADDLLRKIYDEPTKADLRFGLVVALSVVGLVFLLAYLAGWL